MTQADFFTALEQQLKLRTVPFDAGELRAFVVDAWPLIEEDPEPVRWAEEYLESAGSATVGKRGD